MEKIKIEQHSVSGMVWVAGWLFSIGYLHLTFWKGVLAVALWFTFSVCAWVAEHFSVPMNTLNAQGLRAVGYGPQIDEFVLSMNRAAEQAAPAAKQIFGEAITSMTFDDAKKILGQNAIDLYRLPAA